MRLPSCTSPNGPLSIILTLLNTASLVAANVEKAIFMGPALSNIPLAKPSLPDLNLHTLTPQNWSIRTELARVFPSETRNLPLGQPSWLLLDSLTEGQRYEFRVCWAAIEPTSFSLDVYELDTVFETPELIQSLNEYAILRLQDPPSILPKPEVHNPASNNLKERKASVLLLRIYAAADYFSDDPALMNDPPPVLVDLILDPYVYNVLPRSLLPTVGYILVVAFISWLVARWAAAKLLSTGHSVDDQTKKTN